MGVPDGARIWSEIESRHASRLTASAEPDLVASLASAFARLGSPTERPASENPPVVRDSMSP
jgi:hypothetical protein